MIVTMTEMDHSLDLSLFDQIRAYNNFYAENTEEVIEEEIWYGYDAEQEAADQVDVIVPEYYMNLGSNVYQLDSPHGEGITEQSPVSAVSELDGKEPSVERALLYAKRQYAVMSDFNNSQSEKDAAFSDIDLDSLLEWSEALEAPIDQSDDNFNKCDGSKSGDNGDNLGSYEAFEEIMKSNGSPEPPVDVYPQKSVNKSRQNHLKSQGPQTCRICNVELHTKNPYRALQDHYARFHFSENLKILPTEKPYQCPVPDCQDKPYRDWQALMRHYMGQRHGILKKYLEGKS